MANEIGAATEAFDFATTLLGRPRNEASGNNQLKEQSGVSLGDGLVLTDSRFLTANNGGPTDPADLTVARGATIGGAAGPIVTADAIVELTSPTDLTEIALVTTSDASDPIIGMVVYADPNEAAGDLTMTGYGRSDDAAAARAYDFSLAANSYETTTLKNRTSTDDVWLIDVDPLDEIIITGGAGLYQSLDVDGDGAETWYAAGLLVGPYVRQSETDFRFAVDPIGDIYADLAAQFQTLGVSADDIGRNALVAASAGGLLEGTFLNEDFLGSDAADTLVGNEGDDLMNGGGGADSLDAGSQRDTLLGGLGEDTLRGRGGADELFGQEDNDRLIANGGNDTLDGGEGNDTMSAGNGSDIANGRIGDDRLNGGGGDDTLMGDEGNDRLNGQGGIDDLTGGSGNDIFIFGDGDTVTDFTLGSDRLHLRATGAEGLDDLTISTIASGEVTIAVISSSEEITLLDGDGTPDFIAADFTAGDFIFA